MNNTSTNELNFVKYKEWMIEQCHYNFLSQYETAKYTLWKPTNSILEAKEKLEFWNNRFVGNDIFCLIQERKSSKIIGFIAASEVEPKIYGNVGIAIGTDFVNRGYGSQVLQALIQYIKSIGGKKISYSHFAENIASQKLALKFGFKFVKKDTRLRKYDNKEFEEIYYELSL